MEMVKGLKLPSSYVEVTDNEMEYLDAEGLLGKILGTIGAVLAGAGSIVGGVCLLLVPEPTLLTKVGGVAAIVVGVGSLLGIAAIWDA